MSELETRTIEFSDLETRNDNDGHHIVGLVAPFQSRYDTGRYIETLSSGVFDKSIKERSVGFIPIRNKTTQVDGRQHVQRLEAKLDHVGLVTQPAYQEAQVLSTRAYDPDDEELVPRLARWRHLLTNP